MPQEQKERAATRATTTTRKATTTSRTTSTTTSEATTTREATTTWLTSRQTCKYISKHFLGLNRVVAALVVAVVIVGVWQTLIAACCSTLGSQQLPVIKNVGKVRYVTRALGQSKRCGKARQDVARLGPLEVNFLGDKVTKDATSAAAAAVTCCHSS